MMMKNEFLFASDIKSANRNLSSERICVFNQATHTKARIIAIDIRDLCVMRD